MYQYTCLNAISPVGLSRFTEEYRKVDEIRQADAVLVRSDNMYEMELPENAGRCPPAPPLPAGHP